VSFSEARQISLPASVALLGLIAVGLAGCAAGSPTLAKRDGETIAFKVCASIEADSIVVSRIDKPATREATVTVVWEASSIAGSLEAGTVVILGEAPPGYQVTVPFIEGTVDLTKDALFFTLRDTGGRNDVGQFYLSEVVGESWTDTNGKRLAGESCDR